MRTATASSLSRSPLAVLMACLAALSWGCSEGTSLSADSGTDAGTEDSGTGDAGLGDGSGDPVPDAGDPGPADQPGDLPGDGGDSGPAQIPSYTKFQLQARSNLSANPSGAFNLEPDYLFSSEDAVLNDEGQVAFRLTVTPDDTKAIWFGGSGQGQVVYHSPVDAFMSGVALNNTGMVLFDLSFVTTEGLYFYNGLDQQSGLWSTEPLGAQDRSGIRVNNNGLAGFRASLGAGHVHMFTDGQTSTLLVRETALDANSPYSFLFTPDFNDLNQMASKVRLGPGESEDRPDEIRLFEPDGTSTLIASDRDADSHSDFLAFDATRPALNDSGQVAFIATLENDVRGVFLSDGTDTVTIALSTARNISEIEPFSPDVNNQGLVIFRAQNGLGLRAIWAGNGVDVVQIITEHDPVETDQGPGRIDQHDPSFPVFGGTPSINNFGDVVFTAGLTPQDDDQVEWGTGVFTAIAE